MLRVALCLSAAFGPAGMSAASGRTPPAFHKTPAAQGPQPAPSPTPQDMGVLLPGEARRQEMESGGVHTYRLALAAGQYARAAVEQQGIDVSVAFIAPGSNEAAVRMDSPNGRHGAERVSVVAGAPGEYLLEVRSGERGTTPGRYEVRVEAVREPTEADLVRVRAESAFLEGRRLRGLGAEASDRQAVEKYTEALNLWRSLGDRYGEACTLYALGQTHHRARGRIDPARDNLAGALDYLGRALAVFRELNDPFGQAMVNNDTGAALRDLDNPGKSIPFYERAFELYEQAGDQWGKAQIQNNIGLAYARLGDFRGALEHYRQALPIWQAVGDPNMEANTTNNIAGALANLGDPTLALGHYQQVLSIWQRIGSDRLASAYNNIGELNYGFGDTQAALENYERALALHSARNNAAGRATTLNNIGMAYAEMGDTDWALEYFKQTLPVWQGLGQKRGQAQTLDNMGYACHLLGRPDEALGYYQQALGLYREAGDKQGESVALTHLGMLHAARGSAPKALDSYEQAKKIQQEGGLKLGLAITADKLAHVYASAGDAERAAATFREALGLWTELGEGRGRAGSLYGLARVESARGNLSAALALVGQAIEIVESLRARTANQQLRTSLLASKHDYYDLDIDLKMRLAEQSPAGGYTEAAFESSEQARARGLIDLLSEARADIRRGVSAELATREAELKRRLGAVSDRLLALRGSRVRAQDSASVSAEIEGLKREFDELSTRYDDVLATIRSKGPRYAQLTQPAHPSAPRLRGLLDPNTVLLEYALGDERSYLWAVTREGVEGFRLRGRAELQRAAEGLRELLADYRSRRAGEGAAQYAERLRNSPRQYRERAAELGRLVLGPVAERIKSKRVVVVADGALQFIPFEALFVPGQPDAAARRAAAGDEAAQPLGVTNEVVYLPSASTLALLRASPRTLSAGKSLAVFADPVFDPADARVAAAGGRVEPPAPKFAAISRALRDFDPAGEVVRLERLRYTLEEADAIAAAVPPRSVMKEVGFRASRANATSPAVGGYRIVHFATHALLDDKRPELSGLVMSLVDERGRPQDGFLRLGDIYNLNLPVDLVVLSACRTGIGREVRGEGLIGLTRGFMYAGASKVVASLWKVDDEATAALMKSFYRHMLKEGLPAAGALRLAKAEVRQARDEWRAPYFWAGFVLQGDWRPSQPGQAATQHNPSSGAR